MKLTLTYVGRKDRTSKTGKPFTSVSIKAKEYGDKFLSGFGNKANESWKDGDTVEVESVEQKGEYLNFTMPKFAPVSTGLDAKLLSEIATKVGMINFKMDKIIDHLSGKSRLDYTSAGKPIPTFEQVDINPNDIPFN